MGAGQFAQAAINGAATQTGFGPSGALGGFSNVSLGAPALTSFGSPPPGVDPLFFQSPIASSFNLNRLLSAAAGLSVPINIGLTPSTLGFGGFLLGRSFFGSTGVSGSNPLAGLLSGAMQQPTMDPTYNGNTQPPFDPYSQQAAQQQPSYDPYGQQAYNPYGQQQPSYNPYGQQAYNPYGQQQQPSYNPYSQQAYNPYAQQQQPSYNPYGQQAYNPYGQQQQPSYNPYGQQAYNPYGQQQQPSYNPYGQQAYNPYGQQQPSYNPYGQQAYNPYGQQQPSYNPYGQQSYNPNAAVASGVFGGNQSLTSAYSAALGMGGSGGGYGQANPYAQYAPQGGGMTYAGTMGF